MKTEPDNDLKIRFQAQRQADCEQAPVWDPDRLDAPAIISQGTSRAWLLGLPAVAGVLLLAGLLWMSFVSAPQPRLADALPVLLNSPGAPLFAGLDDARGSPSDFLLPSHLQIDLP